MHTGNFGTIDKVRRRILVLAAVGLLTACTDATAGGPTTWTPKPSFSGEGPDVQLPTPDGGQPPQPNGPNGSPQPGPTQPGPQPSGSPSGPPVDPTVVATKLAAPVGLAVLPDGTALVGERTTGRIVRVQPVAGRPVTTVRTIAGIDATGDGGLLDLALSPAFGEDGLIYAYLTTPSDNRVVTFSLTGPVTPILTGIPKGATGNTGRLAFSGRNSLYVGTGSAGQPALAENPTSLAGKVLRVDAIGKPHAANPNPTSPVFSRGHQVVSGLCVDVENSRVYETEPGADGRLDEINQVTGGDSFGWPSDATGSISAAATLPSTAAGAGGCAISDGVLVVATLDGQAVASTRITSTGSVSSAWEVRLQKTYGRLKTVVVAPDGSIWLTTSNKDGRGRPIPDDERVIHIAFTAAGGDGAPV